MKIETMNPDKSPWLPSNGTEGMNFENEWCMSCIREPVDLTNSDVKYCNHLLKALMNKHNNRWFLENNKPVCTAYRNRKEVYRKRRHKQDTNQLKIEGIECKHENIITGTQWDTCQKCGAVTGGRYQEKKTMTGNKKPC